MRRRNLLYTAIKAGAHWPRFFIYVAIRRRLGRRYNNGALLPLFCIKTIG
jgi:hypothetical protein